MVNKRIESLYVYITKNKVETTTEVIKGQVYADLDAAGKVVGFEFLNPLSIKVDGQTAKGKSVKVYS